MDNLKSVLARSAGSSSDGVQGLLSLLQVRRSKHHIRRDRCHLFYSGQEVPPLDVHLCSVGGMGSTELFGFLDANGFTHNLVSDEDGTVSAVTCRSRAVQA